MDEAERAQEAAAGVAGATGLAVDRATVLHSSNKLTVRLLPADVVARVARASEEVLRFEIDIAGALARSGSPVAVLEPRVEPRVYERDGFVVTFWTYHEPAKRETIPPAEYAEALMRLHAGMRTVDVPTPHFTDRVTEARRILTDRDRSPKVPGQDRELLLATLDRAVTGRAEQLLHGEPHPGNVLDTAHGPLFVDFETSCRGPVEFDLAHAPDEVADHYPGVDHDLLRGYRTLMLAMVTAWRWDRDDQLPDGMRLAAEWTGQIRAEAG